MDIEGYVTQILDFVRTNQGWAAPIMFVLAFAESLAFLSLLVPAWGVLVGIGALIGPSGINFWPIWIAASLGAFFGDLVSYWLGAKFGPLIAGIWPLNRNPELLPRGELFVRKWGIPGIFIGRFFGPLRASVPLACGIFRMSLVPFLAATFVSAFVWAAVVLLLGDVVGRAIAWLWG